MSYVWSKEDKVTRDPVVRKPLEEAPKYNLDPAVPETFDSLDLPDGYDVAYGKEWVMNLNPTQTLMLLKRTRNDLMRQVNKLQKEIDRISILELPFDDPRAHTPWPRYYELRVKQEKKR